MLSLTFLSLSVIFLLSWPIAVTFLCLGTLISVFEIQQNFSFSSDMIFSNSSMGSLMVFLSFLLCFLSILATPEEKHSKGYLLCIVSLCLVLVLCFSSANLMMFYVFFEVSLIPTLFLILGWGYQPERLQAGTYMMLYTVGGSLPLLVALLWHCSNYCSMDIEVLSKVGALSSTNMVIFILGAFLFKLPMYGSHLWLPKAHVEAPLAGSMILAGILLKLGGFGLYKMNCCFNLFLNNMSVFVCSLSLWGGLIATLMCLRQVDVKALVAYSSVGHMSIVISGLILGSSWGVFSAVVTMVAHGLSSSAMFCLAYFTYKKSHTRSMFYIKGLLVSYPVLSLWWFLFCCVNMACPPTLNLVGELTAVPILWSYSLYLGIIMGLMMFFGAAYNMYLYSSLNHGFYSKSMKGGSEMKSNSMLSLSIHFSLLLMVLKCSVFNLF